MPKRYYAVRRGRQTGIFQDWNAVCGLVEGFPCPEYKGFNSYASAEAYLYDEPSAARPKYYAIQRGAQTGVFYCTWPEVQHLVIGYPGAVYKGFSNAPDAHAFCNVGCGGYYNDYNAYDNCNDYYYD